MAEKDYKKIAASKIHRPSQVQRMPKFLIYSRNKKGKTTFGISAGVDKTLVIDPESGTDEMRAKDPHVWPVTRWEDMDDVANFVRFVNECPNCKVPHRFDWVCVDGLTKMANMSLKYVMKVQEERSLDRHPGLVQQRDYGKSGELMKDMLTRFHNMSIGVVFTAQERQQEAYDDDEDEEIEGATAAYVPDLPKGVRSVANSLVDVIGRIYVVKNAEGKAERRLFIGESVKYDTGYRSDYTLPDIVRNPTIPKMVRLMRTGQATKKKATQ